MKMLVLVLLSFLLIGADARAGRVRRIAGGEPVTIEQYPFATSLVTNVGGGAYAHSCGGAILTANTILSAASCFFTDGVADPVSWWRARVGSTYSTSGGLTYLVSRITAHPGFVPATLDNDVAVLRTTLTIQLSPGVAERAFLAGGAHTFSENQEVWAIGWGAYSTSDPSASPELRHVQIWTVPQQTCASRYSALDFGVSGNMVCTGWLDVGVRGQCQGDSGSPLLINGYIVGVHSWTEGCAQGWYPGINTRLAPYINWVVATATA